MRASGTNFVYARIHHPHVCLREKDRSLIELLLKALVRWLKRRAKDRLNCYNTCRRGYIFDVRAAASQVCPDQWAENLDPDRA
jgi:hypothetical protein